MLRDRYLKILDKIRTTAIHSGRDPQEVALLAVTKSVSIDALLTLYQEGQRLFGENRIPQAVEKMEQAPQDCLWHFIGAVQSNKINKLLGKFKVIESVDTIELALRIAKASESKGIVTPIFLQANASGEKTKRGLSCAEWEQRYGELLDMKGISIEGLMTMAPYTQDEKLVRRCFQNLAGLREKIQHQYSVKLPHLSMGMSNDFVWAIQEGATIVRIGSAIFE